MKTRAMPIISPAKQLKARLFILRNHSFSEAAKDYAQKQIEEDFARLTTPNAKGAKE